MASLLDSQSATGNKAQTAEEKKRNEPAIYRRGSASLAENAQNRFKMIQNWNVTRSEIIAKLNHHEAARSESNESDPFAYNASNSSKIIPFGFQYINSLEPKCRKPIHAVLHVPGDAFPGSFFIRDERKIQLFARGREKFSIRYDERNRTNAAVVGLCNWIFVEKWNVIIATNNNRQLKVLDLNMNQLFSLYMDSSNLSLAFDEIHDHLLVGGIGILQVFKFTVKPGKKSLSVYSVEGPIISIHGFTADQWISKVIINSRRIYACYDSTVVIFLREGDRLATMENIHISNITDMIVHPEMDFLITASKDGSIKVWNSEQCLIHEFRDSKSTITGLVLLQEYSKFRKRKVASPFLVASAQDGMIWMYNLEIGAIYFSYETLSPVLGIGAVHNLFFYTWDATTIQVWDLNKKSIPLAGFTAPLQHLERITDGLGNRIVVLEEEGTTKLISPISGSTITCAMPPIKEAPIKFIRICHDYLVLVNEYNDIYILHTGCNPCQLIGEWNAPESTIDFTFSINAIQLISVGAVDPDLSNEGSNVAEDDFLIIVGDQYGQLLQINTDENRAFHILPHAHNSSISLINVNRVQQYMITAAVDKTVKLWKLVMPTMENMKPRPLHIVALYSFSEVGIPNHICFKHPTRLAITTDAFSVMQYDLIDGQLAANLSCSSGERPERHSALITGLDYLPILGLFVTSSNDGSIKLWDKNSTVIRDIRFDQPIHGVCFATNQGDLCMSITFLLEAIPLQAYLPNSCLQQLIALGDTLDNELMANSIYFDEDREFWKVSRDKALILTKTKEKLSTGIKLIKNWKKKKELELQEALHHGDLIVDPLIPIPATVVPDKKEEVDHHIAEKAVALHVNPKRQSIKSQPSAAPAKGHDERNPVKPKVSPVKKIKSKTRKPTRSKPKVEPQKLLLVIRKAKSDTHLVFNNTAHKKKHVMIYGVVHMGAKSMDYTENMEDSDVTFDQEVQASLSSSDIKMEKEEKEVEKELFESDLSSDASDFVFGDEEDVELISEAPKEKTTKLRKGIANMSWNTPNPTSDAITKESASKPYNFYSLQKKSVPANPVDALLKSDPKLQAKSEPKVQEKGAQAENLSTKDKKKSKKSGKQPKASKKKVAKQTGSNKKKDDKKEPASEILAPKTLLETQLKAYQVKILKKVDFKAQETWENVDAPSTQVIIPEPVTPKAPAQEVATEAKVAMPSEKETATENKPNALDLHPKSRGTLSLSTITSKSTSRTLDPMILPKKNVGESSMPILFKALSMPIMERKTEIEQPSPTIQFNSQILEGQKVSRANPKPIGNILHWKPQLVPLNIGPPAYSNNKTTSESKPVSLKQISPIVSISIKHTETAPRLMNSRVLPQHLGFKPIDIYAPPAKVLASTQGSGNIPAASQEVLKKSVIPSTVPSTAHLGPWEKEDAPSHCEDHMRRDEPALPAIATSSDSIKQETLLRNRKSMGQQGLPIKEPSVNRLRDLSSESSRKNSSNLPLISATIADTQMSQSLPTSQNSVISPEPALMFGVDDSSSSVSASKGSIIHQSLNDLSNLYKALSAHFSKESSRSGSLLTASLLEVEDTPLPSEGQRNTVDGVIQAQEYFSRQLNVTDSTIKDTIRFDVPSIEHNIEEIPKIPKTYPNKALRKSTTRPVAKVSFAAKHSIFDEQSPDAGFEISQATQRSETNEIDVVHAQCLTSNEIIEPQIHDNEEEKGVNIKVFDGTIQFPHRESVEPPMIVVETPKPADGQLIKVPDGIQVILITNKAELSIDENLAFNSLPAVRNIETVMQKDMLPQLDMESIPKPVVVANTNDIIALKNEEDNNTRYLADPKDALRRLDSIQQNLARLLNEQNNMSAMLHSMKHDGPVILNKDSLQLTEANDAAHGFKTFNFVTQNGLPSYVISSGLAGGGGAKVEVPKYVAKMNRILVTREPEEELAARKVLQKIMKSLAARKIRGVKKGGSASISLQDSEKTVLSEVLAILLAQLKAGSEVEKIAASKALLEFYLNFKDEIPNPYESIIYPQFECLLDSSYAVRIQLTKNITEYNVATKMLQFVLIRQMNDTDALVREQARQGLLKLGIASKKALKDTLVSLGMMDEESEIKARPSVNKYLDKLIHQLRSEAQSEEERKFDYVSQWLQKTHAYTGPLERPDSRHAALFRRNWD